MHAMQLKPQSTYRSGGANAAFLHKMNCAQRQHSSSTTCSYGKILREALTREQRAKLDNVSDRAFYEFPRFVKHVDEVFLASVTALYRERISDNAEVLDLMSSWVSHLPEDKRYKHVVGHGLNAQELARNPQLDSFFVQDLNTDPDGFAFEDQTFDAVTCCVSVQYMQQPERVFAELYRVLEPGGVCIMTFSNRMFYEKAIAAWRNTDSGYSRCQLVKSYYLSVTGFTQPEVLTQVPSAKPPNNLNGIIQVLTKFFSRALNDPFYAVVAYRDFKPPGNGSKL